VYVTDCMALLPDIIITCTNSNTELSAKWTASSDEQSGISGYRYAIGTSSGGTDTAGWTDNGTALTVTRKNLTLTAGTTYYFTVKAVNGALLESLPMSSNGQWVKPPAVAVNKNLLEFGEIKKGKNKTMSLTVGNSGSGLVSGTITADKTWIQATPSAFNGNSTSVDIEVTNDGTDGDYTGVLTINAGTGGTKTVLVTMTATCVFTRPNPYLPRSGNKLEFFGTGVPNSTIRIYSVSGELVKTLNETAGNYTLEWDGKNEAAEDAVSGVYVYTSENDRERNACTFTIIK
jgi:hypothetical protein